MANNLLDKSSIILTPTAYNNGEALCVKPSDGSGDFDFSRNSAATRVNAQGLVENVQILSSELVQNGNFSEIGSEEVSNGDFSQEGSELVTNGDFATDSDWTKGTSWTISGGKANYDAVTNSSELRQLMSSIAVGKTIKVQFDISDVAATKDAFFKLDCSGVPESIFGYTKFSQGTYTYYHTITSGFDRLTFTPLNSSTGGAFSIDNVSVVEVGQDWTLGTGWSIGEDKAISDTTASNLTPSTVLVSGKTYKFTLDVAKISAGSFTFLLRFNGSNTVIGTINSEGSFTFYAKADATGFRLQNLSGGTTDFSVTNISVKEVGMDWTLGTGVSIGSNEAVFTSTPSGQSVGQNAVAAALPNGALAKVSFEVLTRTEGTFGIYFSGTLVGTLASAGV